MNLFFSGKNILKHLLANSASYDTSDIGKDRHWDTVYEMLKPFVFEIETLRSFQILVKTTADPF